MGIPIESRISEDARRRRQPKAPSLASPDSPSNPYRHHPFPSNSRVSGLKRDAIEDMRTYFNRNHGRPHRFLQQPKGSLILVRTFLPTAVRAHRAPPVVLAPDLAQLLPSDSDSDDMLSSVHVRPRSRTRRPPNSIPPAGSQVALSDSEAEADELRRRSSSSAQRIHLPLTYSAVSMLYAENGDTLAGRIWEIGCWAGTHQLAAGDMLHLFFEVLTEIATIPSCRIDELCIGDSLDECAAVIEGVNLLKDLSAELHSSYDKNSDYFIHPMTDAPIRIVLSR